MDTTAVDTVIEPLADTNFKGVFAGLALAGALIAGGVAVKKYVARRKADRSKTAETKTDKK